MTMRSIFLFLSVALICVLVNAQQANTPAKTEPANTAAKAGEPINAPKPLDPTDVEPSDTIFRSNTRLVELHATVVDKEGRLLTDLPQSVFHVFENDVQQEIKMFRREDVPVSMGLIIDNSASMENKRAKVASAVIALVRA